MRLGKKIDRLSSSKMFRILQFTFMLIFACHWYACIWYWAGTTAPPDSGGIDPLPGEDGTSWVWRYDIENEQLGMRYTAALYWAVTTMMKSPWFHPASPYARSPRPLPRLPSPPPLPRSHGYDRAPHAPH